MHSPQLEPNWVLWGAPRGAREASRAVAEGKRTEDLVQLHDGGIGTDTMDGLRRRNAILEDILILVGGPVVGHDDSIDREGRGSW